jgi:transposase
MAKRKAQSKAKQRRRKHSEEFKQEAVKLVFDQQLSVAEAARNLGIHPNLLRSWKRRFETENEDTSLTEDERMEMARLRTENRRLRMERDILKKATAFFANEKN